MVQRKPTETMKKRKLFAGLFIFSTAILLMNCSVNPSIVGIWTDKNKSTQYDFKLDSTFIETDILKGHTPKITGSGKWIFNKNSRTLELSGTAYFHKFSMNEHGELIAPTIIFGNFVFTKQ